VEKRFEMPWTDAGYERLLYFTPLVPEFREEFQGKSKHSHKIKLDASRIVTSVVHLSAEEATNYLKPLLQEKGDELNATLHHLGRSVVASDILRDVINENKRPSG